MLGTVLTPEDARDRLSYDPQTGELRWRWAVAPRVRPGARADSLHRRSGYRIVKIRNRIYPAHRVIWLMVHGRWPERLIDHINRDCGDNRLANLREATRMQNAANMRAKRSGLKGAHLHKRIGLWQATISAGGRRYHLGYFPAEEEAHDAYVRAAREHHGEFARAA
jgi:hypothetical protein